MKYVKWTFFAIVGILVFAFLHYTLPQRDIVRIVDTYEERQDFGTNSIFWTSGDAGGGVSESRDVLFIQTIQANGKPMVYRNEDTGWGWPPYFKFDTADLQTEAADGKSGAEDPKWFAVTHYGWRSQFLSAFPNAVKLRPVEGPDVLLIPWFNIVFLIVLLLIILTLRRLWIMFRQRRIDPVIEDVGEAWDNVDDRIDEGRGRIGRFFDRMFGKR